MVFNRSKNARAMYQFDSRYGFWGTPFFDKEVFYPEFGKSVRVIHDEFGNRSTLNELDQRPRENVLFLGGSHTWGAGVDNVDTYPAIFEAKSAFKTQNFAQCSLGLDQMFLILKNELKNLQPTFVFLELHPWVIHRILRKSAIGFPKPYFSVTNNYEYQKLSKLMRFNVFRKISAKYREFVKGYEEYLAGIKLDLTLNEFNDPIFHLWKQKYYNPMYALAENLFSLINKESLRCGSKLIVVLGPTLQELKNNEINLEIINFSLPRNKLIEILKGLNIEFIDFLPDFSQLGPNKIDQVMFKDGHLNETGHELVATKILERVKYNDQD